MLKAGALFVFLALLLSCLNFISYQVIKRRILKKRRWGLNICCGKTDGGGMNADIVRHREVNNFHHLKDIYNLPFKDKMFKWVLCSHTIEHIEDPERFDRELRRVGRRVVYIIPPLWDIGAVMNIFEHKWIFLTLKKTHYRLPKYIKLPFARTIQQIMGQRISA